MFYCKTVRLANYLIINGCPLLKIINCQENGKYLTFIFKDDEKLSEVLERWKTDRDIFAC